MKTSKILLFLTIFLTSCIIHKSFATQEDSFKPTLETTPKAEKQTDTLEKIFGHLIPPIYDAAFTNNITSFLKFLEDNHNENEIKNKTLKNFYLSIKNYENNLQLYFQPIFKEYLRKLKTNYITYLFHMNKFSLVNRYLKSYEECKDKLKEQIKIFCKSRKNAIDIKNLFEVLKIYSDFLKQDVDTENFVDNLKKEIKEVEEYIYPIDIAFKSALFPQLLKIKYTYYTLYNFVLNNLPNEYIKTLQEDENILNPSKFISKTEIKQNKLDSIVNCEKDIDNIELKLTDIIFGRKIPQF